MHQRSHGPGMGVRIQGKGGLHPGGVCTQRVVVCIWGGFAFREGGLHLRGGESASRGRGSGYRGGGLHPEGLGRPPPTGTRKVGGTHPTQMLSCLSFFPRRSL